MTVGRDARTRAAKRARARARGGRGWARGARRHLRLREPTVEKWQEMIEAPVEAGRRVEGRGAMDAHVREELRAFYEPFNAQLAKLLGDERFRWTP